VKAGLMKKSHSQWEWDFIDDF